MNIAEIIQGERPSLSFEVFPPKSSANYDSIRTTIEEIGRLKPSYMSVTYGAGGGTSSFTASIADDLQNQLGVPTLAHLSCVSSSREGVLAQLNAMKAAGITNVLALRGDVAADAPQRERWDYHYASELVREVREFGGFCVGGACYPEGHPEAPTQKDDIRHLKEKVDAGCSFLVTQMFFDNNILYNFLYKIREAGITVPVVAGIMPVTNAKQIKRIVSLSGNSLPPRFLHIVDRFGDNPAAMKQAGIAFATEQVVDLYANGLNAVHIYSMNDATVAAAIQSNLSEIVR